MHYSFERMVKTQVLFHNICPSRQALENYTNWPPTFRLHLGSISESFSSSVDLGKYQVDDWLVAVASNSVSEIG